MGGQRGRHGGLLAALLMVAAIVAASAGPMFMLEAARAAEREPDGTGRIVGGTPVPDGRYPFMASVRWTFRAAATTIGAAVRC